MHAVTSPLPSPEEYPIGPALLRFAEALGLSPPEADLHARELKRFLLLAHTSDKPLPMHDRLDRLWHEWMLDTRSYSAFCELVGTPTIHHSPGSTSAPDEASWPEFGSLYLKVFGEQPDDRVWPPEVLGDDRTAWLRRLERIAEGTATKACWTVSCGTSTGDTTDGGGDFTTCTS